MIVDKIEDTDGFQGLHGEVTIEDCYRLKSLDWVPDVILDLGANIGVFTRFARSLFPYTYIVAVEPDPENIIHFKKFTPADGDILLIEKAVGMGDMWHYKGAINGAHECYLSAGPGYQKEEMRKLEGSILEKSTVEMIMPDQLIQEFVWPWQKSILKIDIEGGENAIFNHPPSMKAMSRIDYIVMEIHWYALTGNLIPEVKQMTMDAIRYLEKTHVCELDNVNFWAIKK